MKAKHRLVITIFTAWLLVPTGASAQVTTSLPPLACLVTNIAGESIRINSILPVNANHETFEPGLSQLNDVVRSKLIISTGHPHFTAEAVWMRKIRALSKGANSVKLFEKVCKTPSECPDPHIWVSTRLFPDIARTIADALRGVDLKSEIIDNGFATTMARFNTSVAEARKILEPFRGKSFLSYHSAWPYFAEEFGLTELSLEKGGRGVGLAGLTALTNVVQQSGIKAIFVESVESSTGAKSFAESNKLRLEELNPVAVDCVDFPRLVAEKLVSSLR